MKNLREEFQQLQSQPFSKLTELKFRMLLNECKESDYLLCKEVCSYLDTLKASIKFKVVCEDALEVPSIGQFLFKYKDYDFPVDDEFYSEEEAMAYIQKESSDIEEPFKHAWLFFVIITKGNEILEFWLYNTNLTLVERVY
jgi:hypothetical protein